MLKRPAPRRKAAKLPPFVAHVIAGALGGFQVMFPRAIFAALAGVVVCAGSFFGTLAFIDFANAPPSPLNIEEVDQGVDKIGGLKAALIYDEPSLQRAANTAHLQISPHLKGVLDVIERLPDGQVRLAGWAVDQRGDGSPVRILAFAKGKTILEAQTSGERPDVTAALQLDPTSARNVKFELTTVCNPREALVVAAANSKNAYFPLKATVCP
jgi:hypothetical protein